MVLQGIGGGVAASANRKLSLVNIGNRLIIAGIAFQVATMAVCGFLMVTYIMKFRKAHKNGSSGVSSPGGVEKSNYHVVATDPKERKKVIIFCWALTLAYITILIRCIYR